MKFIPCYLAGLLAGTFANRLHPHTPSRKSGRPNPPGTKLTRMAARAAITKRGRT